MTIFEFLESTSKERNAPFLLIGGHAVNAYGYSRFTKDLDILIAQESKGVWLSALTAGGFTLVHDGGSFVQLGSPPGGRWPLDVMMVNAETWAPMLADAREIQIGRSKVSVPSLDHLLALKFHVLRQEVPGRGYKDLLDVLALADGNGVDLRSDRIRHLCHKYGGEKIYERLLAFKG